MAMPEGIRFICVRTGACAPVPTVPNSEPTKGNVMEKVEIYNHLRHFAYDNDIRLITIYEDYESDNFAPEITHHFLNENKERLPLSIGIGYDSVSGIFWNEEYIGPDSGLQYFTDEFEMHLNAALDRLLSTLTEEVSDG